MSPSRNASNLAKPNWCKMVQNEARPNVADKVDTGVGFAI